MTDTKNTIHFKGQDFTYEGLFNIGGKELVALHNKFADAPTRKFSDKTTGVKRTWAAIAKKATGVAATPAQVATKPELKMEAELTVTKEPEATKPETTKPAAKEVKARAPRGMRFVFPQGDKLGNVRPNTNRAKLVELMGREQGATFDECLAETWGKDTEMAPETQIKTTYEAIRLVHYYVGYGMKQADYEGRKGAIHIFFKDK